MTQNNFTQMPDKSAVIFGNEIAPKDYEKACKNKERFIEKYGDDSFVPYHLKAVELPVIGSRLGIRNLVLSGDDTPLDLYADANKHSTAGQPGVSVDGASGKPVVVGNIRMGFGHYRISIAMASAAHAMGYTPYWCDLASFASTTCSKVINEQNDLYSLGSRLSSKVGVFNKLYWEPLNSEGFRKLTYNSSDQKASELMAAPLQDLPLEVPYIGTHVWPAQAAVHANMNHVVNAIPDNWPMALHLAEGALHTVQTPSATLGYRMLRGMDENRVLKPMPKGTVFETGHYIDHELVVNIDADCARREARAAGSAPIRYLLTVGGAGAQLQLFVDIVKHLLPYIENNQAALMINFGDHEDVLKHMQKEIPALSSARIHPDNFEETAYWADNVLDGTVEGIHCFYHKNIFAAVYSTNLLMRVCDLMVTKPSELAYYPVPKLMIQRVGGHEAWGAIRAAEVGDGTYELETIEEITSMIDLVLNSPEIISDMCTHIRTNASVGMYNGAYKVVQLAVNQKL